jgi:hypothetical protein
MDARALAVFGVAVCAAPAWSQTVTFADLQGSVIEASVVYDQTVRWAGAGRDVRQTRLQTDLRTVIGPGNAITDTWTVMVTSHRGTRQSTPETASYTLGRPQQVSNLGGGHAVWTFADGELTFLRTYKTGGYKRTIAFARAARAAGGAGGLTCTIRAPVAREEGAGEIRTESPFGGELEVLSRKQVSSTCRVTRR